MRSLYPTAALTVIVALLGLSGCTPWSSEPAEGVGHPPPAVEITEIDAPPELAYETARTRSAELAPPVDDLPGLVALRSADPGSEAKLVVSHMSRDGDLTGIDLGVDLPGEIHGHGVEASDELAVIAGTTSEDGVLRPFFLTSQDRITWERLEVPEAFNGFWLGDIAVAGGTVYATTTGIDDTLQVLTIIDGTIKTTTPPAPEGARTFADSIAIRGSEILVLGGINVETEPYAHHVWLSTDAGATFKDPVDFAHTDASMTGMVAASDGWVVTGTQPNHADKQRPVSWFSQDGVTWEVESGPWLEFSGHEWFPWLDHDDAVLSAPVVDTHGEVWVWATSDVPYGALYVRNEHGASKWTTEQALVSKDRAPGTRAGAVLTADSHDVISVVRVTDSWAQLSQVTSEGWVDRSVISEREASLSAQDFTPVDDGMNVTVFRPTYWEDEDYRHSSAESGQYRLEPSGIRALGAVPGFVYAREAVDPESGVRIALGWDDDGMRATRTTGDSTDKVSKLDLNDVNSVRVITHLPGTGFVAALQERNKTETSTQVSLATSPEGKKWRRYTAAELGNADLEGTGVKDICELPDGSALAVGHAGTTPAVWRSGDDEWTRVAKAGEPRGAWFSGCITTPDDAIVTLVSSDGRQMLRTTDGTNFEKLSELSPQLAIDSAVSQAGEFYVAGGSVQTPGHAGAVVWMSKDAVSWRWVELPTFGRATVGVNGEAIYASVIRPGGARFFHFDDLATAWAGATIFAG